MAHISLPFPYEKKVGLTAAVAAAVFMFLPFFTTAASGSIVVSVALGGAAGSVSSVTSPLGGASPPGGAPINFGASRQSTAPTQSVPPTISLEGPTLSTISPESEAGAPTASGKAPTVVVQTSTGSASTPPVSLDAPAPTHPATPVGGPQIPPARAGAGAASTPKGDGTGSPVQPQSTTGGGSTTLVGGRVVSAAATPTSRQAVAGYERARGSRQAMAGGSEVTLATNATSAMDATSAARTARIDRLDSRAIAASSASRSTGTLARSGGSGASSKAEGASPQRAPTSEIVSDAGETSLAESVLGVGVRDSDLSLLLLIPLFAIGLTAADLLLSGRRGRSLDRRFRRAVAPGYASTRRWLHERLRR